MIFGLALLASAAAAAQGAAASEEPAPPALAQSCDARKFETQFHYTSKGQPKTSKMRLCGKAGQSESEWVATLKEAVDKTAANAAMPQSVKDQIIGALNGEIARLTGLAAAPAAVSAVPVTADISKLPRRSGGGSAPVQPASRDYAALPPLPTAPTVAPPRLLRSGAAAAVLLPKPALSIECRNSDDVGGEAPCTDFERDTLVSVRARENLPAGTAIRFVRGDASADVDVAGLARGKLARFELPREICRGVGGGKLEVKVVRSAQVVGDEGEFNLRC